jgi:hypothetical protein
MFYFREGKFSLKKLRNSVEQFVPRTKEDMRNQWIEYRWEQQGDQVEDGHIRKEKYLKNKNYTVRLKYLLPKNSLYYNVSPNQFYRKSQIL